MRMMLLAGAVVAPAGILLLWSVVYPRGCAALLLPGLFLVLLWSATLAPLLWRRRCIADCCFGAGTLLHRVLRGGLVAVLMALPVALVGTATLFAWVSTVSYPIFAVLTVDALLVAWLYLAFFNGAVRIGVTEGYRQIFARRMAVLVNTSIMVPAMIWLFLQQPPPPYLELGRSTGDALGLASAAVWSECAGVDYLLRVAREAEALAWQLMLYANRTVADAGLRWVVWLLFLGGGALGLWSYSAVCAWLVQRASSR